MNLLPCQLQWKVFTRSMVWSIKGPLLHELHQETKPWIHQVTGVYKDKEHAEMEFMVLDYRTDWNLEVNEPVAGNYYPINLGAYVEDGSKELSVLVDRAVGGSSLLDGQIELMLHRRLRYFHGTKNSEPNQMGSLNSMLSVECLQSIPLVSKNSIIIFGMDVSKHAVGDDLEAKLASKLTIESGKVGVSLDEEKKIGEKNSSVSDKASDGNSSLLKTSGSARVDFVESGKSSEGKLFKWFERKTGRWV
ncbi:putative alpha-mannosidase [Helianthus anomalus]